MIPMQRTRPREVRSPIQGYTARGQTWNLSTGSQTLRPWSTLEVFKFRHFWHEEGHGANVLPGLETPFEQHHRDTLGKVSCGFPLTSPLRVSPPRPPLLVTSLLLPVSMDLTSLEISRRWDHATFVLLCLASFTEHHAFEVQPHRSMYQCFVPVYG